MVTLNLKMEERQIILDVLRERRSELYTEISETDRPSFKADLKKDKEMLKCIIGKLEKLATEKAIQA